MYADIHLELQNAFAKIPELMTAYKNVKGANPGFELDIVSDVCDTIKEFERIHAEWEHKIQPVSARAVHTRGYELCVINVQCKVISQMDSGAAVIHKADGESAFSYFRECLRHTSFLSTRLSQMVWCETTVNPNAIYYSKAPVLT